MRRVPRVGAQAQGARLVTTLLFLAVLVLALGDGGGTAAGRRREEGEASGVPRRAAMAQTALGNPASSLVIGKVQGDVADRADGAAAAHGAAWRAAGGRGGTGSRSPGWCSRRCGRLVVVGFAAPAPLRALAAALLGPALPGLPGVLAELWAEKFDHMATMTSIAVTPLAFLSGTFHSIERLPNRSAPWPIRGSG